MQKTYKLESLNLSENPGLYYANADGTGGQQPTTVALGLCVRLDRAADLSDVLRRLHEAGIRLGE